jgi:hypothetical protein
MLMLTYIPVSWLQVNRDVRDILYPSRGWPDAGLENKPDEEMVELASLNLHQVWTPSPYMVYGRQDRDTHFRWELTVIVLDSSRNLLCITLRLSINLYASNE